MRRVRIAMLHIIVLVFTIPLCAASLDISVASYDSLSKLAKLKLSNTDQTSYSEIKISVDGGAALKVVDQLSAGSSASIAQVIEPGTHSLVLTTKEGKTVTKSLSFSKTVEQVEQESNRTEELSRLREEELANKSVQAEERMSEEILEELEKANKTEEVQSQMEKKSQTSKTEESFFKEYYPYGIIGLVSILILTFAYLLLIKKWLPKQSASEEKPVKPVDTVKPPTCETAKIPPLKPPEKPLETLPEEKNELEKQTLPPSREAVKQSEEPGCRTRRISEEERLERKHPSLTRDISSLVDYFVNLIGKGYTQEEMINMALTVGWKKEEVEEALREAETKRGALVG